MTKNAKIIAKPGESALSTLRRFTQKMQSSGALKKVRANRYNSRVETKFARKKSKVNMLKKHSEIKKMIKLGKIADRSYPGQ